MVNYTPNGLPSPTPGEQADGPDAFQDLAVATDAAYGSKVADAASLPVTGLFPGQRIWLVDVKGWAVWDGSKWIIDTAWITPSLSGSWVAYGAPYNPPAYRRWAGYTELRGVARFGTFAAVIFNLPIGFRPLKPIPGLVNANAGSRIAVLQVAATGNVTVEAYGTGADNSSLVLDGFRFAAEQ